MDLGLDSAIQLSLRQSRQLVIDKAKVEAARAKYQQARSMELPTARLGASYTRLSNNVDPFAIQLPGSSTEKALNPQILNRFTPSLSFGQVIYAGGQIKYAERSMRLLEEASRLDLEKNRTAVIYNTIESWFNLFKIQQTERAIQENLGQVKNHLRDIRNYEKNGLALRNDVLKIELQLSDLEHSLIEINSAQDVAGYNLNIVLGLPTGTTYQLSERELDRPVSLKAAEDYLTEALANRADLKATDRRIGAAILGVKSSTGNYLPSLNAGANYYYSNPNQRVFPQEDRFKGTWDAGITLTWNISSFYTNKHRVAEDKAIQRQRESEKDLLTDAIKMEVHGNYQAYLKNREKIKVSEQAVTQANENYRIVDNRFRNNTVLISDLTDANTLLLQAKIDLLVDRADAGLAYFKLMHATGAINQF
jgi:outer membrane protein TolC